MLALIPLDNRPCNLRFPQQIAAIGGSNLLTPPENLLGYFNTPGQPEDLRLWLEQLPAVEALIVSIDMLAYGGLVASRRTAVTEKDALANLEVLREFRQARPTTPIYAFNILMRLAVTMDSDEAIANYYNVMRYARLVDEAERFNSEHLRDELHKVRSEIPQGVLREYLDARARNNAVTCRMIDWLAEDVFDYLLITQEDATEFGLHRREQNALLDRIAQRGVADKTSLHPGADEAALTMLARHWDTRVKLHVHWSSLEDAHHIAPFEDRPYDEALTQHVESMRGVLIDDRVGHTPSQNGTNGTGGSADFELFVNAPVGGWPKDENEAEQTARAARLTTFVRALADAIEAGRQVALCDVAFPNGADNVLMAELEKRKLLGKLAVYGGWNTAGNTTGSVLAHCAALKRAEDLAATPSSLIPRPSSLALSRQFLFERLVDDWFYQSRVRARVEKAAREQGLSPINLIDTYEPVEAQTRRELRGFAQLLAQRHFGTALQGCEVMLPWHRTFEVDVRVKLVNSQLVDANPSELKTADAISVS
ncbi:MAG: DUF4127 family protein [Abitibacteriaceae bacterium]|nr:DUF4127 family protein [Abditibacteriaceae bacterium]